MILPTDEKELTELLAKQQSKTMKLLAIKFESKLDEDDRKDIFHNACIAVWENFKYKDGYLAQKPGTFEGYFQGICSNMAMNTIRNREMTVPNSRRVDENGRIVTDRVSKTVSINAMQREDADGVVDMDKVSLLMDTITSSCDGDVDILDIEAAVQKVIAELPDNCNRIFHGMYWDDIDQKAIAEKYGFSNANTVKSTKTRCVKKFKDKLATLFPEVFKQFKK